MFLKYGMCTNCVTSCYSCISTEDGWFGACRWNIFVVFPVSLRLKFHGPVPLTHHMTQISLCPQKQRLAKVRRESETQKMTTTMMTMKTMIKSKTENESLSSYPSSPTNPKVRPPTIRTAFVIHVYPPQLWALFMGQDCTGWVGQVELPHPFFLPLSPPHGTESHPTPSTSPTPRPRGSQAAQHSAFHNFTVDPSLCIPVWGLWDWYLVLGLCF